jgi:hypothetical protein
LRIIIDIEDNKVVSTKVDSSPRSFGLSQVSDISESALLSQEVPPELLIRAKEMGATSAGRAQIEPFSIRRAPLEILEEISSARTDAIQAGTPNPELLNLAKQEYEGQMSPETSGNLEIIDAGKQMISGSSTTRKARKRGVKSS